VNEQFNLNNYFEAENKVHFNCASVEDATRKLLAQLGASEIIVNCIGGIQEDLPTLAWDSSVKACFNVLKKTPNANRSADAQPVVIQSSVGSILLSQLFRSFSDAFDIQS
jgi:hypothetical protein